MPIGWAAVIVGTERSCWVTATGDFTSYEESEAHILTTQAGARRFACEKGLYERFPHCIRTVPALTSVARKRIGSQGLPTRSGYALNRTTDPKPLTKAQYWWLSGVAYALDVKEAYLTKPTAASALLLRLADRHRSALQGLDFEPFCEALRALEHTRSRFPVEGLSPNWVSTYQFVHNSRHKSLLLRELLTLQDSVALPFTPTTFDTMGLPLDHTLRVEASAIALFEL